VFSPRSASPLPFAALNNLDGTVIGHNMKRHRNQELSAFATGQACGVAAARYAHKADSLIAEIQTALREQGALIDGDDLPDPVTLQYT
jgi:hypothetical protein